MLTSEQVSALRNERLDAMQRMSVIMQASVNGNRNFTAAEVGERERLQARVHEIERQLLNGQPAPPILEAGLVGTGDVAGPVAGAAAVLEDDVDARALASLPRLSARTSRAMSRLYGGVAAVPAETRARNWAGVVAAALGGAPLSASLVAATATEGFGPDGGFTVSAEVASQIFARAVEMSVWARIGARVEPMTSNERIVPALTDDDETDDSEAGLTAGWTGEGDEATPQVMKLRRVVLNAKKLMILAASSNELGDDAPSYLEELELALSRAIAKKFDRAVLSAPGGGAPLGLLNAAATITVTKESGQTAAQFLWENAVKMWARLAPGSHENAWWLMHPTVLPQALSMTLAAGTAGFQPRGAFEAGGPTGYTLLTRPVVITSRVKPLGTKGDVILVDPSQVAIGIRRGITVERSEHAFFSSDRLAVRARFRGDAQPFWNKPRTLVEGNTTVSPYVVLESR